MNSSRDAEGKEPRDMSWAGSKNNNMYKHKGTIRCGLIALDYLKLLST